MAQKRTRKLIPVPSHEELMEGRKKIKPKRKPIPVPSHEELMEGRKKIKPYRPKPKKKKEKKKEKKKSPVQTLLYKGRPVGSRKRSVSV